MKYKSVPFSKMSPEEIKISATRLLLKISFITGWSLYEDDASQGILKEQFQLKLMESYPNVNVEEVEFAFRNNTTVEDWGKFINLAMMDKVMIPYLESRRELSNIEENLSRPALQAAKEEDELSDEDFLEANRGVFNFTKNFGLIHPRCYDILVKREKIILTDEEKEEIRKRVKSWFFAPENSAYARSLSYDEKDRFMNLDCKKVAVSEYFSNSQS